MTYDFCRAFIFAVLAVVCLISPARATTLPLELPQPFGLAYVSCGDDGCVTATPGGVLNSGRPTQAASYNGPAGHGVALVRSGQPFVSATVFGPSSISAQALEIYNFRIAGPTAQQMIPVTVTGKVIGFPESDNANGFAGGAFAEVQIQRGQLTYGNSFFPISAILDETAGGSAQSNYGASRSFIDTISIEPNTIYTVRLAAQVGSVGTATADPFFQIDMSWLAANPGYSLEFSPGIVNEPLATPLPPALPMFSAALLALGAFGRWRRRYGIR